MTEKKILTRVCKCLAKMNRNITDDGVISAKDENIMTVSFRKLRFDSLDRAELSLEFEKAFKIDAVPARVYSEWDCIGDVVKYAKTLN